MAFLLADIGGTNARFCWLKGKSSFFFDYKCDNFKKVTDVIDKALKDFPNRLSGIIVAAAGPVQNGRVRWTNRPQWHLSQKELQKKYHIKNALIVNDVQAQGEGLKTLYKCFKTTILMTAGTGLGGCFIINGKVTAGEIGQIITDEKLRLEDFVSGPGIVRLYQKFSGGKKVKSARKVEELRQQKDKIAQKAFCIFYQEWGKIAARFVTGLYAIGGIYLWGGLIPKTEADKKTLMTSYKNTLPKTLRSIPLRLVKDKKLTFKGLVSLSHREFY